jgi:hypothetical protein
MAAPDPMQYVYKPLKLETLAVGAALAHRLDTSDVPDTIKADLERLQRRPGRYRVTHAGRKVERMDGQALTDQQWNLAMDRFNDETEEWQAYNIGAWMGSHITQSADGRTWTVTCPEGEYGLVLGLGVIDGGAVVNTYFENGALKGDDFLMLDEVACEWRGSVKWELTRVDELVLTRKEPRYIEELDMQIVFIETFLARRFD